MNTAATIETLESRYTLPPVEEIFDTAEEIRAKQERIRRLCTERRAVLLAHHYQRPEVQEVSAGVYAYVQPDGTWWINNTGFLTGPQGVISIDACSTERRTRAYQAAIAAVTPAPVRTVLNTHHHGDHTFGNCLFPGAAIVAHERARAEAIATFPGDSIT